MVNNLKVLMLTVELTMGLLVQSPPSLQSPRFLGSLEGRRLQSPRVLGRLERLQAQEVVSPEEVVVSKESASVNYGYAVGEVGKYGLATGVQYGILAGLVTVVGYLPPVIVGVAFAFLSLRSRIFSFLDNSRPDVDANDGKATPSDVKRPKWTPPGKAFPIIWLTITGLRAVSAALATEATQSLAITRPLLLHLCIGDTWNTITNVEKRLGVSAIAVFAVWASLLRTLLAFYDVKPLAAWILAPSLAWISVACLLTNRIWALNGGPSERPPFPSSDDGSSAPLRFKYLLQLQPSSVAGK